MDTVSSVLSVLLSVAFVVMLTPGVLRLNHGKILRNIALWLAILMALGLAYRTIGPGAAPQIVQQTEGEAPEAPPTTLEPRV